MKSLVILKFYKDFGRSYGGRKMAKSVEVTGVVGCGLGLKRYEMESDWYELIWSVRTQALRV